MAGADQTIQLSVRVNAETGQLEVLGAKFKEVSASAKGTKGSFADLGQEAGQLLKAYLPFATAGGIIAFFAGAVRGANEHAEAMRRLKGMIDAAGGSFDDNKSKIVEWSEAIQAATRFDNDQALQSLQRFIKVTGDLTTSMRASKLAMDISVATGKDMADSERILVELIAGNERGLRMATKELGGFTDGARTAQTAIDALQRNLGGAAEREKSFAKDISQTKAAWQDFARTIGEAVGPAVAWVITKSTALFHVFETIGIVGPQAFVAVATAAGNLGAVIGDLITGKFKAARSEAAGMLEQIKAQASDSMNDLHKIWGNSADDQIREAIRGSEGRIHVITRADEEAASKLAELEAELNQKIASLGDDTFAKRRAMAAAEIANEKAKIDKEFKDEVDKNGKIVQVNQNRVKALAKLGELEVKQNQEINKEEVRAKQAAAMEIGDLSLQSLALLNAMGDSHNRSEIARAKVILALEKSIAIARAIAEAQKGGPFAAGIAAASIALITAQFATQYKAIDEAAHTSTVDTAATFAIAGGGFAGDETRSAAPSAGSSTASVSNVGTNTGSVSGGGANITVSIQLNVGSLDITNADALLRKVIDAAKSGTLDALSKAVGQRLVEQINGTGQISFVRGGG